MLIMLSAIDFRRSSRNRY